jgi:hypothetical protein
MSKLNRVYNVHINRLLPHELNLLELPTQSNFTRKSSLSFVDIMTQQAWFMRNSWGND